MKTRLNILTQTGKTIPHSLESSCISLHSLQEQYGLQGELSFVPSNLNQEYTSDSIAYVREHKPIYLSDQFVVHPIIVTPANSSPCIWEKSATSLRIEVTLVCNNLGQKKKAIFIKTNQQEHTGDNALIPIDMYDIVIKTTLHNTLYSTKIYSIQEVNINDSLCKLHEEYYVSDDFNRSLISYERIYETCPHLKSVIKSSKRKAKKGPTFDIHYALYEHILQKNSQN